MSKAEFVFLPAPAVSHLAPMVELAKILVNRVDRLSITVFIMNSPNNSKLNAFAQTLLSSPHPPRLRFVDLSVDESAAEYLKSKPRGSFFSELIHIHKPRIRDFLSSELTNPLTCFVIDMICTSIMDVAAEFGVPSYVFFTCSAGFLGLMFHLQSLQDDQNQDIAEFKNSDTELRVSGFVEPVPAKVIPYGALDKESGWAAEFMAMTRDLRKAQGILVNTFVELESHAVECLLDADDKIPPVYQVGPILNFANNDKYDPSRFEDIISWLDNQPPSSVVFLCFGSMGTFDSEQVMEVARALEQSGHRFLWSLRKPPPKGTMELPADFDSLNDVLPEGFLDRTNGIGKVIGWAPQVAVLSHSAVGGFVSHCGWNSTLESLWCGVPVAAWPLYAEQQINAFEMVKELGLSVEIKIDYRKVFKPEENQVILTAEEIGRGIKQLMEGGESTEIRKKVKAMREKSRMAVVEGGSSYVAMGRFIEDAFNRSP